MLNPDKSDKAKLNPDKSDKAKRFKEEFQNFYMTAK
jgi:hypothetical protein